LIDIINPKPISEIDELRDKGLYNAPFSVLEAMGKIDLGKADEEILNEIRGIKDSQAEFVVTTYEEIARVEEKQDQAIVELYESVLGGM